MLIGLASRRGAVIQDAGHSPRWQHRLDAWIAALPQDALRDCVMSLIREPLGWPVLHSYHVLDWSRQARGDVSNTTLAPQLGSAYLGVAAYYSAESAFQDALKEGADEIPSRVQLGYTYWRLGYYEKALDVFWPVVTQNDNSIPMSEDIPGSFQSDDFHTQPIASARRMYLETARDALRLHMRKLRRRQLSERWKLQQVISLLEHMDRGQIDARAQLLGDLVILDINRLLGNPVASSSAQTIFQQSFDLQLWTAASAAAGVWASIHLYEGLKATFRVGKVMARQGNTNYLGRLLASTLYALLPIKIPLLLKVLDGPISMRPKARFVELDYRRRRRKWKSKCFRVVLVE